MEMRAVDYEHDGVTLRGKVALPTGSDSAPGVLVAHDWTGRNAMAERVAGELAQHGYVGLALDMYGEGRTGASIEDKAALMAPLAKDRELLMGRMNAALDALRGLARVDGSRTAAIGFCFGGKCVLDLARSGADVGAVVSFHGLLDPPPDALCKPIRARVLALHGHRDPMVPPEVVTAFEQQLEASKADWELHVYGHAVHAFTNPAANDASFGTVYDERVARRAFAAMHGLFDEVF